VTSEEPSTSDEQHPKPEAKISPTPPARRRPSIVLILALVVAGLGMIAAVVGYAVYTRVTAIDRSTPTVVVGQFLVATIKDRDVRRVALFTCNDLAPTRALEMATGGIEPSRPPTWEDISIEQQQGSTATVTAKMKFRLDQETITSSETQTWTFRVVNEEGWRVCQIERP